MRKPSFLERLTGAITPDDYDDLFDQDEQFDAHQEQHQEEPLSPSADTPQHQDGTTNTGTISKDEWDKEPEQNEASELAVDVYETPDEIVVKALVAGVTPANLDVSLTRDMVTINGTREEHKEVEENNYFYHELYWGSFTRTILLPEEIEVDESEASERHGILVIRMPKINKAKKTKLKVKSK